MSYRETIQDFYSDCTKAINEHYDPEIKKLSDSWTGRIGLNDRRIKALQNERRSSLNNLTQYCNTLRHNSDDFVNRCKTVAEIASLVPLIQGDFGVGIVGKKFICLGAEAFQNVRVRTKLNEDFDY
ncbi:MAG: hypothetical protein J6W00_05400 [Lentisphaeria bacterium]|nr:hypothetical protein [Lentisphaeria bacterium]